ncbi:hypothetical protein L3V82_04120 [Thiotrichales bacterium 19S3-7]|nr:hypothetical protein [Thiotrichales bacterium 19S3-7]MCF6801861.1 hypothetical protein [Thiotrichales bacterium 19S3-11]
MKIIPAMKALGYHPDEKGVCYGISHMGTQALLRGDYETFQKRMSLIHSLSQTDLLSQISAAETKRSLKQSLNERENLLLSIKPFFDGISIYQNAFNDSDDTVKQNIHPMMPRQDYHVGNQLFNGESTEGIHAASKSLKVFSEESLVEFLTINETDMLEAHLEPEPSLDGYQRIGGEKKDVLIYNISIKEHIVTVAFDQEQWHLIDHDKVWSGTDKRALSRQIMESLHEDELDNIVVYVEENTSKVTDHTRLAVSYPKISATTNVLEAGKLLAMAVNEGMMDIAREYYDDMIGKYKRDKNLPIAIGAKPIIVDMFFNDMLSKGNHRLIKKYCDKVNDFDGFTYKDQKAIFTPESQTQRNRAIYSGIRKNNHKALKAYFDGIRLSWLSPEEKRNQMLSHLSDPNIVRLFNESKVKKETMAVFVETLTRLKFDEVQRSKLPESLREALPPIPKREPFPVYGTFSTTTVPPRIFSGQPTEKTPLLSVSGDF